MYALFYNTGMNVHCVFSSYPVSGVDFSINQFVRNLGLEHLIDIFEREQVSGYIFFQIVWARKQ